jgi:lipoprotein-anchoring transpeptidase ErfK/SrfK
MLKRSGKAAAVASRGERPSRPKAPHTQVPGLKELQSLSAQLSVEVVIPEQKLYLVAGRRRMRTFPVSTGINISTPRGTFRVTNKIKSPSYYLRNEYYRGGDARNPLGASWLGLNVGHWKTGTPIGIHGTNEPGRIGKPVSRGCVRLRNEDVLLLYSVLPVNCRVTISD